MTRRAIKAALMVSAAMLAAGPRGAEAQSSGSASMYANPIMNPYMNPFMNPYMTQTQTTQPGNLLMYMYAANQANGGIGSGRISGTRPSPSAPAPAASDVPMKRASDIPGGGAAGYFNRGPIQNLRNGQHYNRSGRYYENNGR